MVMMVVVMAPIPSHIRHDTSTSDGPNARDARLQRASRERVIGMRLERKVKAARIEGPWWQDSIGGERASSRSSMGRRNDLLSHGKHRVLSRTCTNPSTAVKVPVG